MLNRGTSGSIMGSFQTARSGKGRSKRFTIQLPNSATAILPQYIGFSDLKIELFRKEMRLVPRIFPPSLKMGRRGPKLTYGDTKILQEIRARLRAQEAKANHVVEENPSATADQTVHDDGLNIGDAVYKMGGPDLMLIQSTKSGLAAKSGQVTAASHEDQQKTPLTSAADSEASNVAQECSKQQLARSTPESGPPAKRGKVKEIGDEKPQ
eukprot:TRINITY_DN11027_c0_g1_i1.p2 TRINITY_DN11027_c0_g1~~TRINITY_DN11027_c0_g1_i1.p2  ORF type:complete len:210 (+),score=28.27 TRINITY_DN11027_c0_g1_i1:1962-2591(+)